jgi:hypothetical protein
MHMWLGATDLVGLSHSRPVTDPRGVYASPQGRAHWIIDIVGPPRATGGGGAEGDHRWPEAHGARGH